MYNAHRIHRAAELPGWFTGLRLSGFVLVNDRGELLREAELADADRCAYGCGMFRFVSANAT